jgi:hypothetical protein
MQHCHAEGKQRSAVKDREQLEVPQFVLSSMISQIIRPDFPQTPLVSKATGTKIYWSERKEYFTSFGVLPRVAAAPGVREVCGR